MTVHTYRELDICYMANGDRLSLPIHVFSGGPGPTVGFTASIHGDEIIGVEILRRLAERLKSVDLHGTVKILPLANPLAFEEVNRNTPIDRNNLNRCFPGKKDGMVTERMAYMILEEFSKDIDMVCDIHSGGREPMVDYIYIQNDEPLARSFGSKVLYSPPSPAPGYLCTSLIELGIQCMIVEIGGGAVRGRDIEYGLQGIINVLKYKGILEGACPQRSDQIVLTHIEHVNPKHGGMLVPCFTEDDLGKIVEGHQVLARIYNPKTLELLEELKAPFEKNLIVLLRPHFCRCHSGDYSFMIGEV